MKRTNEQRTRAFFTAFDNSASTIGKILLIGVSCLVLRSLVKLPRANAQPSRGDLQCVVRDSQGYCVLWYDPETRRFYNEAGEEVNPPWQ